MLHLPRYCELWLPGYIQSRLARQLIHGTCSAPKHVWLAIADHFEPLWQKVSAQVASQRVGLWRKRYPEIAAAQSDSEGRSPVYTFFYPEEQYRPELVDSLAEMTGLGIADVEVHLHHDGEGEQNFIDRISFFKEKLYTRHGLLRKDNEGIRFAFIHGNWALDNSLPGGAMCGLDNEITLLRDLGCYADFTMPSGASPTQSRTVNTIYWAKDDPSRPKSYDRGYFLEPGKPGGDLLMIPGPLGLRWRERCTPRLETGEVAGYDLPTAYRVKRWLDIAPRLGEHIFVKLFAHGAQERNSLPLLDRGLPDLFTLSSKACAERGLTLHYVSTWQMYRVAVAIWKRLDPLSVSADSRGLHSATSRHT